MMSDSPKLSIRSEQAPEIFYNNGPVQQADSLPTSYIIVSHSSGSINSDFAIGQHSEFDDLITAANPDRLITSLLGLPNLTSWERSFIKAVAGTQRRSAKQIEKLEAIAQRRLQNHLESNREVV